MVLNLSTVFPVPASAHKPIHQRVTYRVPAASKAIPSPVPISVPTSTRLNVPFDRHHRTGPVSSETMRSPRAKAIWADGVPPAARRRTAQKKPTLDRVSLLIIALLLEA